MGVLRGTAEALDSPDGRSGVEVPRSSTLEGFLQPMPYREYETFPYPYKNKVN